MHLAFTFFFIFAGEIVADTVFCLHFFDKIVKLHILQEMKLVSG